MVRAVYHDKMNGGIIRLRGMGGRIMKDRESSKYSRRDFLKIFSVAATGSYVAAVVPYILTKDDNIAIAAAEGYLLVDVKKCAGCTSCMLACSLVHEGKESPSLSRIKILQDPFGKFPDDITMAQCRQCENPLCVAACPTGALFADKSFGSVRRVHEKKCIGCMQCLQACPFTPKRLQWDSEENHARKCDLCTETPFWNERGGPGGKQACVEICPMRAIKFTDKLPKQEGDQGYHVCLRNENWAKLGFPTD